MENKEKLKRSIKACSTKDKKCDECICNSWLRDTCQEVLLVRTLKLIEQIENKEE